MIDYQHGNKLSEFVENDPNNFQNPMLFMQHGIQKKNTGHQPITLHHPLQKSSFIEYNIEGLMQYIDHHLAPNMMMNEQMYIDNDNEKYIDQQCDIFDIYISKLRGNILSLKLINICNNKLFETILNLSNFPKLFHLSLYDNIDYNIIKEYNFSNIRSLEFYNIVKNWDSETENVSLCMNLNMILKQCTKLLSFYCALNQQQMQSIMYLKAEEFVIFPSSLQFLYLSHIDEWINIDISSCNNLIAFYLEGSQSSTANIQS